MRKLPLRLEVWGYSILSPPARTNTSSLLQAGFVCVAAISNRLVFLLALGCCPINTRL
jgi:hypothetical protein